MHLVGVGSWLDNECMTEEEFATIKEHANGRGQFDAYIIRRELGILVAEVERLRMENEQLHIQIEESNEWHVGESHIDSANAL